MKLAAGKNPQLRRQSELSEFETKNRKIVVKRRYKFSRQTRTCLQRHKHKLNLVILNKDKESEKEQKTSELPGMLEDLTEGFKTDTIETEGDELVININEATHNISWLPPGQRLLTVARGIEPHQLPAPII